MCERLIDGWKGIRDNTSTLTTASISLIDWIALLKASEVFTKKAN